MKRITDALKHESTWRGIIALLASFGVFVEPQFAEHTIAAGLALIGGINIVKKAPKNES